MSEKDTLYARWLSGLLSEDELQELQSSGALRELEQIKEELDHWSLPAYNKTEGLARLQGSLPQQKTKVRRLVPRWAYAAAASLLLLLATWFLLRDTSQTLTAPNGQMLAHTFVEGSKVQMNDGSSISYDPAAWAEKRLVKLSGEAYFEVEKGVKFIVQTNKGTVEVLGTKFNVNAWGEQLMVECYEGRVAVNAAGERKEVTLGKAVIVNANGIGAVAGIDRGRPMWQTGQSRFENAKIKTVFEELERQYDIKVNAPPINRNFTGGFTHTQLDDALKAICLPLQLKYEISQDKKSVRISE